MKRPPGSRAEPVRPEFLPEEVEMETVQSRLDRIALALREQRLELGVSLRWLAAASNVSRETLAKAERGGRIRPELLLRAASVLTTLELYAPPEQPALSVADENGNAITFEEIERRLVEMAS
jgi:transcriptional regulator with XRE-family HTH domain